MKNLSRRFIIASAAALTFAGSAPAFSATVELVYANGYPRTTISTGIIADEWISEIEKATEGRVTIRHVPGGALLKPENILEGVRNGVADIGAAVIPFFPGQLPISATLSGTVDLADGNRLDPNKTIAILQTLIEEFPELRKEYDDLNLKPGFWIAAPPYGVIATRSVAQLPDFQNLKIRTFGVNMPKLFSAVGAAPLSMAFGEVYTSLQTGVIDACLTDPPAMVTNRLYEVAKYVVTTGPEGGALTAVPSIVFVFNKQSWAKIPPADQAIIEDVSKRMLAVGAERIIASNKNALEELAAKGAEIAHMSEQQVAELASKSPDFYALAAQDINAKGLPGDRLIARYRELAAKYISGELKP
jgi:TRAP-type C4-dicarboxylate transport system substrate-binding protein